MTYGLRIINDDSELLIDSELFSPTFVQKLEFNTTPTITEAGSGSLHPGYIKRQYETPTVSLGSGNCIVFWTLPDNGSNDIYYNFESSTTGMGSITLICSVYANSTGSALTYSLPTAYIFAVDADAISGLSSSGPALRMYNSASPQKKTFDSNLTQLAPYSITDSFAFSISGTNVNNYGTTPVSIALTIPTSPIFLLPDYHGLRINKGPANSLWHEEYLYETGFRRVGSTLYTRLFVVEYSYEDYAWPITQTTFTSGNNNQLSVIVADSTLYAAISGGTGGGTNPTYQLTADYYTRNEGTTVIITLTTTLVANGTVFPYTVTGISAADLSSGSLTGTFTVISNSATASFTFANDLVTEGTEVFTLSLDGLTQSVNVTINDTSIANPPYGTAIGSPYCLSYGTAPYTLRQVRADGIGGTYNDDTNNSTTCGYVAPTYNESFSISSAAYGDYIVALNSYTTISITGGQPYATVNYATTNYWDPQPSSFPDSVTLDASGNYSNYLTGSAITGGVYGDKMIWVYFPYNAHVRSARVKVVEDYGTPSGGQYCVGYTLTQNYYDGHDSTYSSVVQYNSPTCGYVPPPPTATWDVVFSNNGSAGAIYCGVNVYLSAPATTTVTFTFSGTVQDNGASFNVPSVTITAGNTAGAGYEYSGFTNGSGPYSQITLVASVVSAPYSTSPGSISNGFSYSA